MKSGAFFAKALWRLCLIGGEERGRGEEEGEKKEGEKRKGRERGGGCEGDREGVGWEMSWGLRWPGGGGVMCGVNRCCCCCCAWGEG